MTMQIYLNNAGAGLMANETYEAVASYLHLERELGAYCVATQKKVLLETFYTNAAQIINASSPTEIAFMDSASRGWNMVIYGSQLHAGDKIVTLSSEFGTNLIILFDYAKQINATVRVVQCNEQGEFSIDEIEDELRNGAKLVAISHTAAQGSIVNPVEEIGRLAKKYGAIYVVDGCQAVGQFSVDVQKIQCDAYVTTGRKWLCGPRGTGFLYIKDFSLFRTPQLDLASAYLVFDDDFNVKGVNVRKDARQFELWERSYANMLGLATALDICLKQGIDNISARIQVLANKLRLSAQTNPNFHLLGKPVSISGVLGFYLKDYSKEEELKNVFIRHNIGISMMSDWDCPLYFPKNGATQIFRLSPHYYSDFSSIEKVCKIIEEF